MSFLTHGDRFVTGAPPLQKKKPGGFLTYLVRIEGEELWYEAILVSDERRPGIATEVGPVFPRLDGTADWAADPA